MMSKPEIYHIVIEGSDEGQMQDLFEEIQNGGDYYDNCVLETLMPDSSIIEYGDGRDKETGGLKILPKKVVLGYTKKILNQLEFETNLKGLNELRIHGKTEHLTDDECRSLVRQIVDKLFGGSML